MRSNTGKLKELDCWIHRTVARLYSGESGNTIKTIYLMFVVTCVLFDVYLLCTLVFVPFFRFGKSYWLVHVPAFPCKSLFFFQKTIEQHIKTEKNEKREEQIGDYSYTDNFEQSV